MNIKLLAIDLAKDFFQLYATNSENRCVLQKKLKRIDFLNFMIKLPPCTIFMEACSGSNYWGRKFKTLGHTVLLISPQHVKPFVGVQKNDRNDSRAILEAGRRLECRFVPIKELWQQDLQCLHRIRERLMRQKIQLSNQIRSVLTEYGFIIKRGDGQLKKAIPQILESADNELTPILRRTLQKVTEEFKHCLEELKYYTQQLTQLAKSHRVCLELQTLKGVGPLIATAFISAVGDANGFKNGRQVSAWLGLVPRQNSTGGKTKLLGITKTGNSQLRSLMIQGARVRILLSSKAANKTPEDEHIVKLTAAKGFNKASVAIANRYGRKMWAIMKYGTLVKAH